MSNLFETRRANNRYDHLHGIPLAPTSDHPSKAYQPIPVRPPRICVFEFARSDGTWVPEGDDFSSKSVSSSYEASLTPSLVASSFSSESSRDNSTHGIFDDCSETLKQMTHLSVSKGEEKEMLELCSNTENIRAPMFLEESDIRGELLKTQEPYKMPEWAEGCVPHVHYSHWQGNNGRVGIAPYALGGRPAQNQRHHQQRQHHQRYNQRYGFQQKRYYEQRQYEEHDRRRYQQFPIYPIKPQFSKNFPTSPSQGRTRSPSPSPGRYSAGAPVTNSGLSDDAWSAEKPPQTEWAHTPLVQGNSMVMDEIIYLEPEESESEITSEANTLKMVPEVPPHPVQRVPKFTEEEFPSL